MLAASAVHVENSRGRRFPEPQHPYRNDFQRDRDRVIHARAFRRLEAKTQVFTRRYSDHFRNRLTHTLEVAQISRTIAGALDLNVDLAEALRSGPRHRPSSVRPCGRKSARRRHARSMASSSTTTCMHCASSKTFEQRYAAFSGLNLTFEVREGIIKHSHDYSAQRSSRAGRISARPAASAGSPADRPDRRNRLQHRRPRRRIRSASAVARSDPRRRAGLRPLLSAKWCRFIPTSPEKLQFNEAVKAHAEPHGRRSDHTYACAGETGWNSILWKTSARIRSDWLHSAPLSMPNASRAKIFSTRISTTARLSQRKKKMPSASSASYLPSGWRIRRPCPTNYQEKAKEDSLPRVICDYIAGMTDHFIFEQYERHCGA